MKLIRLRASTLARPHDCARYSGPFFFRGQLQSVATCRDMSRHLTEGPMEPHTEPFASPPEPLTDEDLWNITNARVGEVWRTIGVRGEGIVVANIDSGVAYDHPALVKQYRGNVGQLIGRPIPDLVGRAFHLLRVAPWVG